MNTPPLSDNDQNQITLSKAMLVMRGFRGGLPIVCEGPADTALARAALISLQFNDAVSCVPEAGPASFCVIGTRSEADNTRLRQTLDGMKAVLK